MAIYHFSVKTISRSAGRSAVACSAYRSGEKLIDERQGKEQDYTKKTGVEFTKIYAPENTNPELLDRNQLWNTVEKVERRKDANLAREFEIAFPHELNKEQRERMLNDLCQELVKRHGVIVDAAIHAPHTQSGSDERNYHAHIMFTGRQIDPETGDFAKKRNRDFNKENSSQTVNQWRETFADITNQNLARAGYLTEVDHRSYADQNNGLQATIHEGSKVTQLRRQGIDTEISLKNDLIKQQNAENQRLPEILKGLEQEIRLAEFQISKYQAEMRLEASKNAPKATEAQQQVEQPKPKETRLERKSEPSSPKLKQLNDDLNRLESEIFQLKRDISTALKDYDELQKNKPQKKLFGLVPNPKFSAWKEKYSELKHEFDRKKDDLKLNETLVEARKDDIKRETIRLRSQPTIQPNISREKPKELDFNSVYRQLNHEQKQAYQSIKSVLEQKLGGSDLDKKLEQAQQKFVEKFKENPNFEVPKLESQKQREQEQVRGASKSKGMER
ncbi:MobQ family relaxase [Acinetobacter sp. 251-1]|uniref:MobQ family relaxase n=1 Tax=Acinetobacter sp. 251-1 TaxID=2746720 RepID=UPI0025765653|nr:MobQ family relaxase [Acinetobacter sp. 251-1]MDM1762618.1 MobA/MobL family protein [Acinetobacter sp. 251-1]